MKRLDTLRRYRLQLLVLVTVILTIGACKKDANENNTSYNGLMGEWKLTQKLNNDQDKLQYILQFQDAINFSWTITSYSENVLTSAFGYKGTFLVNGNRISFKANEQRIWDTNNPAGEIRSINQSLFDSCSFVIKGDTLQLNYITYPADGPVPTQAFYSR